MMKRMGGADAFFMDLETPRAHMHTFKISIIEPGEVPWSFAGFHERSRRRLHRLPILRWRYMRAPLGQWSLFVDARKIYLQATATGTVPALGDPPVHAELTLNPMLVSAGFGYRF